MRILSKVTANAVELESNDFVGIGVALPWLEPKFRGVAKIA